jgi:hypothetical protein
LFGILYKYLIFQYFNMSEQEKKSACKYAETLGRAGRYEEAAFDYERLAKYFNDESLLDKARELRDKAHGSNVKITTVNVNEMLRQLEKSGVAISYRCPNCSASLSIKDEMTAGQCGYCGSKIEKVNLAKLLNATLH